jgi:hypothetical protein
MISSRKERQASVCAGRFFRKRKRMMQGEKFIQRERLAIKSRRGMQPTDA